MKPSFSRILKSVVRAFLLLILVGVVSHYSYGQKEANIWYFGNRAGLDFNYDPPRALENGVIVTTEGCASVADANGDLLFYTDGSMIWNKWHKVVQNGSGLLGDNSSTQSAVVVPYPGQPTKYFVFTVNGLTSQRKGVYYNVLDVSANNNEGKVINANVPVIPRNGYGYESIGATKHATKEAYWVCVVEEKFKILSYLVDKDGVAANPVISTISDTTETSSKVSHYMKFSSDNKYMAVSIRTTGLLLCKFDAENGTFSKGIQLTESPRYGLEFSPNSKFLYTSNFEQFDVSVYDRTKILNSVEVLYKWYNRAGIQLAPDGKIYFTYANSNHRNIGVIKYPDLKGTDCQLTRDYMSLKSGYARQGLPTFLQSFVSGIAHPELTCLGDSSLISLPEIEQYDSILWNLGDSTKLVSNNSEIKHLYADTGTYLVTAVVYQGDDIKLFQSNVRIYPYLKVSLGEDKELCDGYGVMLEPNITGQKLRWQDSTSASSYFPTKSGEYWVNVLSGCYIGDTVSVNFIPKPLLELGADTLICEGDSILLKNLQTDRGYEWQNGSTDSIFWVSKPGIYTITKNLGGCSNADSVVISFRSDVPIDFGNDTVVCTDTLILSPRKGNSCLWFDGTTKENLKVVQSGTYWAKNNDGECESSDSIDVQFLGINDISLPNDTTLCKSEQVVVDLYKEKDIQLNWNDGSTSWYREFEASGLYKVTARRDRCVFEDSIHVEFNICPAILEMPNIFSPNDDGLNDEFYPIELDLATKATLYIYNRWGELLAEENLFDNGWDGSFNGKSVPAGTYFYKVDFTGYDNIPESVSGVVTLVR